MPDSEAKKSSLVDSIKGMMATLLAMGQTRLELISTEIEEEREWLTSMLIWTLVALFSATLAVTLAAFMVVVIFWDSYRLEAISIMIGIFVLAAVIAWRTVCKMNNSKPRIFSSSIAELSKDREQLTTHNE